jgi:hypothetical protein
MSTDLEKRCLQGRVKSVRSETVEFEKQAGQFEEKPWLVQTESFDPEGRLSETSFHNAHHPEYSSRQTFAYDSTGRLAEESFCSEGRGVTSNTQCLYDSQSRLVQRVSLDGDGKATGKSDVLYDADGNKLEESSYDAGGKLVAKTEFTYHPNGNRSEEFRFDYGEPEPNVSWGYTIDANPGYDHSFGVCGRAFLEKKLYDLNGNPAQLQLFDKIGNLLTRVIFTTDDAGRIVKHAQFAGYSFPEGAELPPEVAALVSSETPLSEGEIIYDAEGRKIEDRTSFGSALFQTRAFKYDAQGELIEDSTFNADGELQSRAQIKWEYDSKGNWIMKLVSSWNNETRTFEPSLIERRDIKYHD